MEQRALAARVKNTLLKTMLLAQLRWNLASKLSLGPARLTLPLLRSMSMHSLDPIHYVEVRTSTLTARLALPLLRKVPQC